MTTSNHVIEVNEIDFEYEVINYSQNIPVVVDFWAPWCGPCKTLGPMLERMAQQAQGVFRLAKVNIDDNPNLAIRFGVRSIPNVKAFSQGQVVAEFSGAQPEARVREFLNNLVPSPISLSIEKGNSLLAAHEWSPSEKLFREVLSQHPDQPAAFLGLVKSLLGQGQAAEANIILHGFPPSREYAVAEILRPYAEALSAVPSSNMDEDPYSPAFWNSIRLAGKGKLDMALDGMLDILRQDKNYRRGQARQIILSLLELMGEEDPQTRQYRSELTSILF